MYVRKKKNRSGSTCVVVADKSSGKFIELRTIGIATPQEEIESLVVEGNHWIAHYGGQQSIDFECTDVHRKETEAASTEDVLSNIIRTSLRSPQTIINRVYDKIFRPFFHNTLKFDKSKLVVTNTR